MVDVTFGPTHRASALRWIRQHRNHLALPPEKVAVAVPRVTQAVGEGLYQQRENKLSTAGPLVLRSAGCFGHLGEIGSKFKPK